MIDSYTAPSQFEPCADPSNETRLRQRDGLMPALPSKHTLITEFGNRRIPIYPSRPNTQDKRPAMIMLHEYWGLTDHMISIADRYAQAGYVAAAPYLFCWCCCKG